MIALVVLSRRREVMGAMATSAPVHVVALAATGGTLAMNLSLLLQQL